MACHFCQIFHTLLAPLYSQGFDTYSSLSQRKCGTVYQPFFTGSRNVGGDARLHIFHTLTLSCTVSSIPRGFWHFHCPRKCGQWCQAIYTFPYTNIVMHSVINILYLLGFDNVTPPVPMCSEGFFLDDEDTNGRNATNLCKPACGEFLRKPVVQIVFEDIAICGSIIACVLMFIMATTVQRKTL